MTVLTQMARPRDRCARKKRSFANMNKVYMGMVVVLIFVAACMGQARDEGNGKQSVEIASGTNITAELQKSLDVDKTRVGDEVVLKTKSSIRQNGHVAVPKGSTLIGRVTEVQKRTKENALSRI